jgi:TolB protein
MYKVLLLLSLVLSSVFAQVDANLEVVKKTNALPKMLVSVATDSPEVETLNKIKKSLADDLSVSGHFEVGTVNSVTSYENMPDIIGLSNQGINLYLNLSAKKEAGSYTLMTKLYDINSRTLILEKNFTTTQEDRYVFLAHKAAISTNAFFKAPPIDWMEKFVVFSTYAESGASDIMIGDYTLTYKKTVVSGGLNIFPKWADKEQKSNICGEEDISRKDIADFYNKATANKLEYKILEPDDSFWEARPRDINITSIYLEKLLGRKPTNIQDSINQIITGKK